MAEIEAGLTAALADAMWVGLAWCYWRIAHDLARPALAAGRSWVWIVVGCIGSAALLGAVAAGTAMGNGEAVPRALFYEWAILALILGGAGIASARRARSGVKTP